MTTIPPVTSTPIAPQQVQASRPAPQSPVQSQGTGALDNYAATGADSNAVNIRA